MSGVYDVGTAEARTFEDMCDILEIPYSYRNEADIPKHYQHYTKADSDKWLSGWTPKYSLDVGLQEYSKNFI